MTWLPSGTPSSPFGPPFGPCLALVGHSVWPRLAPSIWPRLVPSGPPSGPCRAFRLAPFGPPPGPCQAPRRSKIFKKIIYLFIWLLLPARKEGKKYFGFQSPRSPSSPSSAGFVGEATRRRRFFWPNSPSHPSKLYSSLGWLNSKVPKSFFPFILRLINVDGF
jgi:hypothetical protein